MFGGASASCAAAAAECVWQPLRATGELAASSLREASGLAASARRVGAYWSVNDSGNAPKLYALDAAGHDLGQLRVDGARNYDWEDLAAFRLDDKPYLLIADIGDNEARRKSYRLYVVAEPEPGATGSVPVAWTIAFVYTDGPRDAESVAVDAAGERVLLLSKREARPGLYTLPLRAPADGQPARARRLLSLDLAGSTPAAPARVPWAHLYLQPTAMDLSSSWVAVLTYGSALLYPRADGESVPQALARAPQSLVLSGLAQAEALAFGPDATLYVTGEGAHPALLRSACE